VLYVLARRRRRIYVARAHRVALQIVVRFSCLSMFLFYFFNARQTIYDRLPPSPLPILGRRKHYRSSDRSRVFVLNVLDTPLRGGTFDIRKRLAIFSFCLITYDRWIFVSKLSCVRIKKKTYSRSRETYEKWCLTKADNAFSLYFYSCEMYTTLRRKRPVFLTSRSSDPFAGGDRQC